MSIRDEVRLFAESSEFNPEGLNYIDCPECGRARKMMVVEDDDGLFFRCFAATCSVQGKVGGTTVRQSQPQNIPKRKVYGEINEFDSLQHKDFAFFEQFGLNDRTTQRLVKGAQRPGSYVQYLFPVYGPTGLIRGEVLRRWGAYQGPKAMIHPFEPQGALSSWYFSKSPVDSEILVLVEDQVSAARLSVDYDTVALLGTKLSQDAFEEILGESGLHRKIVVCLDSDATKDAIKMVNQLRAYRESGMVILPNGAPDIKDMSQGAYVDMLKYIERATSGQ